MSDTIKKTELLYNGKTYHVAFNFDVIDILEENFGLTLDSLITASETASVSENLRRVLQITYALICSEEESFITTTSFRDFKKSFVLEEILEYSPIVEEVIKNAFPSQNKEGKPKGRPVKKVVAVQP